MKDKQKEPKYLFKILNSLLHKDRESPLPDHNSVEELVEEFSDFFISKINKIRDYLDGLDSDSLPDVNIPLPEKPPSFSDFEMLTVDEVKKLIKDSPTKSCSLDPIHTGLLKNCMDVLAPIVTHIINLILSTTMPPDLKIALVVPLLKKAGLDLIKSNFRPVSNLPFIGKISEKAAASQLRRHMCQNGIAELFQSSYTAMHSTETALLRVSNDILQALDKSEAVLLIMLDLSAAFDTIDHRILVESLQHYCGVTGHALQWFTDYLSGRQQSVFINGVKSHPTKLMYGVPQGSVLGPMLFTIYMLPLGHIMRHHGVQFHIYADDTQLYMTFDPKKLSSVNDSLDTIMHCVLQIKSWMLQNKLKLNDSKTEYMIIRSKRVKTYIDVPDFKIGESVIQPSSSIRNLGSYWDNSMSMKTHVRLVSRTCYFQLHNIHSIKRFLTRDTLETLVHAFITARLDYGNALIYGIPDCDIKILQRVQNNAAKIVTGKRKFDESLPILKSLHWLPISYRIQYKIVLTVYKCLNGVAPVYLQQLLLEYDPGRYLKSDGTRKLTVPKSRKCAGDRSFCVAGPRLWNALPISLRLVCNIDVFKRQLKTHMFQKAFSQV